MLGSAVTERHRLLILVVAYEAADTLVSVIDRIPGEVFESHDCEVLVLDDASTDRTAAIGRAFAEQRPDLPITVLRNTVNQGYGGNQKAGYAYAIDRDFDFVAMVHGDGQYAPERLPDLLEPLVAGQADAVFGSRMIHPRDALRGGMPLYKWVGNRILTTYQNAILGTSFAEFHSGYRIYTVDALRKVRFRSNTNDFHFDTEIILQFLIAGLRIVERPIPTYYGDEISRVNGLKYAANVARVTLRARLHQLGFVQRRRFDPTIEDHSHYRLKLGYASSHQWAIDAVPDGASVLDIGAGPGGVARQLVRKGCTVATVDQYEPIGDTDDVKVYVQDLDEPIRFEVTDFDHILMLDVIEHLKDPELFMDRLRAEFDYRPRKLILTTPNVAFAVQRLTLAFGQFNYGRSGILDRTHTRLFTFRTLRHLLEDAGFTIDRMRGIPPPIPLVTGDNAVGRGLMAMAAVATRVAKTLFSYQIYVEATSRPDVDFVLLDAMDQD